MAASCKILPAAVYHAVTSNVCSPSRRDPPAFSGRTCIRRQVDRGEFGSPQRSQRTAQRSLVTRALGGNSNSSSEEHKWASESEDDYIEATVVDAVKLVPNDNALVMKMADGKFVKLMHANATAGRLLYYSSVPTIFLKMEDESDIVLPIVVGELPSQMLMKALRREAGARPTVYDMMKEMVETMKYEVKMVRITQRVVDTYYARVYMYKPGSSELISVDARPSDAINLAVRCNVKIYVNKTVVAADGVRPVYTMPDPDNNSAATQAFRTNVLSSRLDMPQGGNMDPAAEEIVLIRDMIVAASEERYKDAAKLRDDLATLRSRSSRQRQV